jgi:hypothetical protein
MADKNGGDVAASMADFREFARVMRREIRELRFSTEGCLMLMTEAS